MMLPDIQEKNQYSFISFKKCSKSIFWNSFLSVVDKVRVRKLVIIRTFTVLSAPGIVLDLPFAIWYFILSSWNYRISASVQLCP